MSVAVRASLATRQLALSVVRRHNISRPFVKLLSNRPVSVIKHRVLKPSTLNLSMAAGKEDNVKNLTIEEVISEGKKGVLIIDVRELVEIHNTGLIPGSVNIPLGNLEEAMKLPPDQFKERFSVKKPEKTDRVIMSCQSGNRSKRATIALQGLGFINVMNNAAGWKGYEELNKGII